MHQIECKGLKVKPKAPFIYNKLIEKSMINAETTIFNENCVEGRNRIDNKEHFNHALSYSLRNIDALNHKGIPTRVPLNTFRLPVYFPIFPERGGLGL